MVSVTSLSFRTSFQFRRTSYVDHLHREAMPGLDIFFKRRRQQPYSSRVRGTEVGERFSKPSINAHAYE